MMKLLRQWKLTFLYHYTYCWAVVLMSPRLITRADSFLDELTKLNELTKPEALK